MPFSGHAGGMGATPDELQHQQAGAEEESPGRAGCAQVVRQHYQTEAKFQVHDKCHYDAFRLVTQSDLRSRIAT